MQSNKIWLWLELTILFVVLPLALFFVPVIPQGALFGILWGLGIYAIYQLSRQPDFSWRKLWQGDGWQRRDQLQALYIFLGLALLISVFTYIMVPERFLGFPKERPQLWLMVMVLYPVLSVLPQELMFRSFFYVRYQNILPGFWVMLGTNAFLFGLTHIMFKNWVAPLFCLIGGLIFAAHYQQHRSLKWVVIEHAIYGCFIFTIGLGWYFYHGAAR